MKIAIATRPCDSKFNMWNSTRIVDADKPTIVLTCFHSLVKSIKASKYDVTLSIHDDHSSRETLTKFSEICEKYGINFELYHCESLGNFASQYEWMKKQEADYYYCVEDDYLHRECAIDEMVDMCEHMREFFPGDYAVYPFNSPHRYHSFDMLYPSYIIKGKTQYWRSALHSTHTFFINRKSFLEYDDIMKFQAYNWPKPESFEDKTINNIWHEQNVRLLSPLTSLAFHLADETQEENLFDWKKLWNDNLL